MQSLLACFHPGQRVYVAGSSNEPRGLLAHLATLELPAELEFIQFPLPGLNTTDFTALNEPKSLRTFSIRICAMDHSGKWLTMMNITVPTRVTMKA